MLIIISQIIFVLSVLGILFLIFRRIPDLLEYPRYSSKMVPIHENLRKQWKKIQERVESSEFLHEAIIPKTEKFLRKTKVVVLKFDNFLARKVNKLRQRTKRRKRNK